MAMEVVMPLRQRLSNRALEAKVSALSALFDGGFLDIFEGAQPSDAEVSIKSQKRLVSLQFKSPAFESTRDGAAKSYPLLSSEAEATGTASWYRCYEKDHKTVIEDGSVGTSESNLNLSTVAIRQYATVSVSSYTISEQLS